MLKISNQKGQATIEYVLTLVIILMLGIKLADGFRNFVGESMGNLAHVLSGHLSSGICEQNCFFNGYKNGN